MQQLQAEEGVPRKRAERIVDAELAEQAPPKPAVQQPPATLDSPAIPATLDAPSPVINLQRGGKVSHATATAPKQPVRLSNIIETLESVIERPVRTGRLGRPEEVQGFWRVKEEVVRARYPNDVAVTAHEIGHGLEKLGGVDLKGAPPAVVAELDALGKALYGNRQPNAGYPVEGWAEAVRKHVQGESVPPATEAFLTDVLARNPKMRDRLAAARQMAAEYEAQGPDGRFAAFQVSDRATIADSARKVRDVVANVTPGTSAFRERWVTGLEPIEAAERAAGTTTVSQSPRTATGPSAWAMHATKSAPMKAREFVQHGTLGNAVGKGLADILAPVVTPKRVWSLVDKERVQAWKDLTLAKRAKDYEARGLESGLRPDDVDAIIARHGNDPVLAKAATEAVAWRSRLFDDVLDAAGIDPVQRQAIRDANPNYAHLDRVFRADEGSSFEGPGRGLGGVGNPVKRRTGSTREVRDILETDIRDAERLIAVADKLRAQKALIEWAEANEGMGRFVEKIPKDKVPTKFTLEEIAKEVEQATGVPLDATSGALEATIWRAAKSPPGGENIVSLWRNGQQEWFQVEPRLYRTYMGLGPESALPTAQIASLLSKSPLGMASRGLRLGATGVNAGFSLLSNPFRDFFAAAVYGRRGSYLKGVAETLRPTEASRLYGAGGVEASTFAGVDRAAPAAIADRLLKGQAARGKVAMVLRHPVDSFRALSGALEGLPRKGEFRALLEAEGWKPGGPPPTPEQVMRASNAAADVTTNFRRAGEWGRVTNVVTAFQNPALQGLDKTVRTWRSDPVRTGARFSAYVGIPTLTLWWVNKDDPEYKTLPAWQRKGFWNAKIGERWYRVPKPPNLGVLANMLEDSADAALADGSFPTGLRQTLAEAWKTETPPVVPDAARITADVLRNEASFTGRPIVPKRLENVKPEEQYLEHTSETGKAVGKALGVSPAKVDYAAEQATGGLSRDIVGGAEKIAGLGKETAIYKKPPVVGRFMSTGAESDDFEKFWDLKKELEQGRASVGLHRREAFRGPAAPSAAPAQIAHLDGLGKRLTRLRRLVLEAPDGATRARARAEFAKAAAEARAKAESFLSRVAEKEPR